MTDVRRQLEDLLRHPREDLSIEIKGWLDLTDGEQRADLGQALLALANHGGGHVIIGVHEADGKWEAATPRPASLDTYSQDVVNAVVSRYAEPVFHCDVHHVAHPQSGEIHPIVVVPGGHRVPIRSKSASPTAKHIRNHIYYIRRPGPASEAPQNGREWDELIGRCVRASREELLARIRDALVGVTPVVATASAEPSPEARLATWIEESRARWQARVTETLGTEKPSRFAHGVWSFAYAVLGEFAKPPLRELKDLLRKVQGRETGWPAWMVFDRDPLAPYAYDGMIECWLGQEERDGAHTDFWRVSPEGFAYVVRGHQEDAIRKDHEAGAVFDLRKPVWIAVECLLHARRLALALAGEEARVQVRISWDGLKDRKLVDVSDPWRAPPFARVSQQDGVAVSATFGTKEIEVGLSAAAQKLTRPLYEVFDFFALDPKVYDQEIARILRRA